MICDNNGFRTAPRSCLPGPSTPSPPSCPLMSASSWSRMTSLCSRSTTQSRWSSLTRAASPSCLSTQPPGQCFKESKMQRNTEYFWVFENVSNSSNNSCQHCPQVHGGDVPLAPVPSHHSPGDPGHPRRCQLRRSDQVSDKIWNWVKGA